MLVNNDVCMYVRVQSSMILFIMWYQIVCNCRQYCFDVGLISAVQHTHLTMGLYTRDYPAELSMYSLFVYTVYFTSLGVCGFQSRPSSLVFFSFYDPLFCF